MAKGVRPVRQLKALQAIANGARTTWDVHKEMNTDYIQIAQSLVRQLLHKGWVEIVSETSVANHYKITARGRKALRDA